MQDTNQDANENTNETDGRIGSIAAMTSAMFAVNQSYSKAEYEDFIKVFRRTLAVELAKDNDISLHSFVNFHIKHNKDRIAKFTGKPVFYKGNKTIGVTVSPTFREEVQALRKAALTA